MVATVETISEPKLHGKRRRTSIFSPFSVVKKSSSMNSGLGIWSTLIHREVAEVNGVPMRINDQQFGSSDDLFIDHCSLVIERRVRNRSYNAALGRWLQRDPIGYAGGINLYEYVGGRPAIGIDPAGEFCCSDQCSRGACPRFLRITYRKRSCLYPGTGASGIEQGLRNFEKYFYFPGSVLKWPVEPDIVPGVPIGAITGAGGGISNRLEKNTGVYIEGTMEYETCELRPCLGVLTQWVWSQQESPKFVFPVCVPDTVPWVTWAEAWLLYVMRRGYFPILSAATCGH